MARVTGQPRIENGLDGRVGAQPFGQQRRRPALCTDAQIERPQPPQQKEGVERTQKAPRRWRTSLIRIQAASLSGGGDGARNHIGMAVEIFRGGMHDEIATAIQRSGQDRGGDG